MKRVFIFFLLCISISLAETINVLAAANLSKVLEEIKKNYLKNHKKEQINITYMSSGKAFAQLKNQIPVSLFVSADTFYPQRLFEEHLTQKPKIYAQGVLVLWSKTLPIHNLQSLTNQKIKNIALPNPDLAPYGRAAKEALNKKNLSNEIDDKIRQATSVSQAHQWVENGDCEVGFGALSLLNTKDGHTSFIKVDPKLYAPIQQALAITNFGKNSPLTRDFADFILQSKQTFKKYGYLIPQEK
ncbi:molybdate-binding lipoprotein [Helicobacter mustelae]|uniref:molybdate ABC transporter substrate-binding protein n=1 Tax=Helicobacter mustelae TaxID=217 RepID=UPI000E0685AE|nr:molybdate ABC transporter substrate-binding protein [Helicobacter mustelae]STP13185.1 molybdate-binding lipoprotein [Helicobacter mustelae]